MAIQYLLLVAVTVFHTTLGYSSGPPIAYSKANICIDMFPHGHNAIAQTTAAPFEVLTSQSCYNHSSVVEVRVRITDQQWYFEGFFVQARLGMDNTTAHGMFDAAGQTGIQELDCFGASKSAIGHSQKKHYWSRTFNWTAPSSAVTGNLHFRATLVKNEKTFWVGVSSAELMYNSSCTTGTQLPAETLTEIQPSDSHEDNGDTGSSARVLVSYILLLAMMFCTRL